MNWLSLFSSGIDKVIDSVGSAIDSLVTSDKEKLTLRNELEKISVQAKLEIENNALKYEKEITKRWTSDNENGSFLSRNIRPASLIYLLAILTIMAFADGNIGDFKIADAYISLFEALAITAFGGYFVARSVDKFGTKKQKDMYDL